MGFFGSSGKKEGAQGPDGQSTSLKEIARFGGLLSSMVVEGLARPNGTTVPEDALAMSATIAAERAIDAASVLPLRDHELIPGTRVQSNEMNSLLFGDSGDGTWEKLPPACALGFLRAHLLNHGFQPGDFPDLPEILRFFDAHGEDPVWFGTAPLTVPKEHWPRLSPLKIGFESRRDVDDRLRPLPNRLEKLMASLWSLMEVLIFARQGLPAPICLRLAVEIFHGMAKTAPMTARRADEMKKMNP